MTTLNTHSHFLWIPLFLRPVLIFRQRVFFLNNASLEMYNIHI